MEEFDLFNELEEIEAQGNDFNTDAMLEELNNEQREAVMHLDGPLLILAGAGSGKTRVITYRIAYMIKKHNIYPGSILAITFTNKAANEMKSRINSLIGDDSRYIWCGTFHSIFARILRSHAEELGYTKTFNILDTDDQLKVIKDVMKTLEISDKEIKPKTIQYSISDAKNKMMSASGYASMAGNDYTLRRVSMVYTKYEEKLKSTNSMDFDDILINTVKLFRNFPDILEIYQRKFSYIMVDEYQDTNDPQYLVVKLLSSLRQNICVVGDDDQSIYAFRGANVQVILNFEKDFPAAKVVKLEENYRSTKTILAAANEVIHNNKGRKDKTLRTSNEEGNKIVVMNADSQIDESNFVCSIINRMISKGDSTYSDMAILYRMNSLSRSLEMSLRQNKIPYKIYGGIRFYDRKEIKDVIAYLRLVSDSRDDLAFARIINVPARGIGLTTISRINELAVMNNTSSFEICENVMSFPELSRAAGKIDDFVKLIYSLRTILNANELKFSEFMSMVQDRSGIIDEIIASREKKGEAIDRVENLKELLSEAVEFEKKALKMQSDMSELTAEEKENILDNEGADTLSGMLNLYLQNVALYSEGDNIDENEDFVRLMSIHSAKGLEFNNVFLIGVEENIFPSYQMETEKDLEEERRLMYVAITRAKKNLFMILAQRRTLFGQTQCNAPSRFLKEIDDSHVYKMGRARQEVKEDDALPKGKREEARRAIKSAYSKDFLNKPQQKASGNSVDVHKFKTGVKVEHPRFGEGLITKSEMVANDALVTIDFDGMVKNLLVKTSGIKIVE